MKFHCDRCGKESDRSYRAGIIVMEPKDESSLLINSFCAACIVEIVKVLGIPKEARMLQEPKWKTPKKLKETR